MILLKREERQNEDQKKEFVNPKKKAVRNRTAFLK